MMATLSVNDLMTHDPVAVQPGANLQTARDLMDQHGIRHLPVTDEDGVVVGLVSQRDLMQRALAPTDDLTMSAQHDVMRAISVDTIMTPDVDVVEPAMDIVTAGQLMLENKYGCLPVVDGDRLTGILTEADFVRYLSEPG
ncbi:MAG: CBS domain-containing protein [Vicinamibacterales bacterium]|jgi:CBS domain-containing membrane protein|nr:CBS domain-containing protein [Vicinamibacterales bacterium]HJN44497.1 CBS domain-containing protein [Vicinamibacterales bacterium]|tara:strand:- start:833 stop:1252 length:420 start_codon:yes stop_codon:yes gene_type:complete